MNLIILCLLEVIMEEISNCWTANSDNSEHSVGIVLIMVGGYLAAAAMWLARLILCSGEILGSEPTLIEVIIAFLSMLGITFLGSWTLKDF